MPRGGPGKNKALVAGALNGKWRGGATKNERGYVRLTAGPGRGRYAHRWIMERLLDDPISLVFSRGGGIPKRLHVHHVDHDRAHNCPGNLMLLDTAIHNRISRAYQMYVLAHYDEYLEMLRLREAPEWVTSEEEFGGSEA